MHPSSALTQTLCWLELLAAVALAARLDGGFLLRRALRAAASVVPGSTLRSRALVTVHVVIAVASVAWCARAVLAPA
jgi:hypothetical protein